MNTELQYERIVALTQSIFEEPELGYKEFKTAQKVLDFLEQFEFIEIERFSTTGIKATLSQGKPQTVGLIAELDAVYAPKHFQADVQTGAAHNCGHFSQVGALLSLVNLLANNRELLADLSYNVVAYFVPAEEYLDLAYRQQLKKDGHIQFYGGKQEAIRLGAFDELDAAICIHSISEKCEQNTIEINCDLVGFLYKYYDFQGKASHAGFDPFGGINAYNMSTLFNTAVGLRRQQFKDSEHVRINPVVMHAEMTPNIIPDSIRVGTDIRTKSVEYMLELSIILDEMAQGTSQAMGGTVQTQTEMGYLPFIQHRALNDIVHRTYEKSAHVQAIIADRGIIAAAGDVGDLSYLVPTIQIGYSGFSGTIHGIDFKMENPEFVLREFPLFMLEVLQELSQDLPTISLYKRDKADYLHLMEKFNT
ncbi:MAG: M20/M25/M40 family metallo-hydrolase [Aerococcaceae bacterium]|nr:M20/M25/M40 family metallo-hydrolase [Aerococcaceae bacterium]